MKSKQWLKMDLLSHPTLLEVHQQYYTQSLDYIRLNELTVPDSHQLPRIDDTLDALGGSTLFSTLDLKSEFHQVSIAEEDRTKTVFSIPGSGLWQFYLLV